MKATDIELAFRVNPETLFTTKDGWQARIVKVHERTREKTPYLAARREVDFTVETIAVNYWHKNENDELYRGEPVLEIVARNYKPKDFTGIATEQRTLEEVRDKFQPRFTEEYREKNAKRLVRAERTAKLHELTGIGRYTLNETPEEVINALYDALTRDKVGA